MIFQGTVGVADLDNPRPITTEDEFRIGSVTKTYVAALVLQLLSEGKLALEDSLQRWLPDLVPRAAEITIELLLRMRSGLPDYVGPVFGNPPDLRALNHYWSPQHLIQMALTDPDRLPPDSTFRYCNADYVLLGLIIEKATGESVEAQLWQRIIEPAKLSRTTFPTADPYLRGPHASGHLRGMATMPYMECTTLSPSEAWTAGGIVATPGDVAEFYECLFEGTILDPVALALMTDCNEVIDPVRTRASESCGTTSAVVISPSATPVVYPAFPLSRYGEPAVGVWSSTRTDTTAMINCPPTQHSSPPRSWPDAPAAEWSNLLWRCGISQASDARLPHRTLERSTCNGGAASSNRRIGAGRPPALDCTKSGCPGTDTFESRSKFSPGTKGEPISMIQSDCPSTGAFSTSVKYVLQAKTRDATCAAVTCHC